MARLYLPDHYLQKSSESEHLVDDSASRVVRLMSWLKDNV